MFLPLDQLADTIDKKRLLAYLTNLGNSFEAMLNDKREIAALLMQRPIPREDLEQIASRLDGDVRLARERVKRVALLKGQYKEQGERIAPALLDTFLVRKSWLSEMRARIPMGSEDQLTAFSERVTASETALEEANRELAKLCRIHPYAGSGGRAQSVTH